MIFFSFSIHFAFAKISLVEIMYDAEGSDSDKEWVAIVNDESGEGDLSTVRFVVNGTNHLIIDPSGATNIPRGKSALIVDNPTRFKVNFPNYSGLLYDSSFSLTNTSGTVALKDEEGSTLDTFSYDNTLGAAGDGKSLQKISGVWKTGTPIFGALDSRREDTGDTSSATSTTTNSISNDTGTTAIVSNTTTIVSVSSHSGSNNLVSLVPRDDLAVSAGRERITTSGTPLTFTAKQVSSFGSPNLQVYSWSFGDGFQASGAKVSHTYIFPGEYVVVLNTVQNEFSSVSRANVKVIEPKLALIRADNESVGIKNTSVYEINLNGWQLQSEGKVFVFPLDTIIRPGKEIFFPSEITHLVSLQFRVELVNPSGKLVAYGKVSNVANAQDFVQDSEVRKISSANVEPDHSAEVAMLSEELRIMKEKLVAMLEEQKPPQFFASAKPVEKVLVPVPKDKNEGESMEEIKNTGVASTLGSTESSGLEKSFLQSVIDLPRSVLLLIKKIF